MTEETQKPSLYAQVKAQIPYKTGTHAITCPSCQEAGRARVRKLVTARPRSFRDVSTSCRHCGAIITFRWYNQ